MIDAKIILDSTAPNGRRLITWELTYWRAIHAEFMTHCLFSRNAGSSRAVPTKLVRERVRNNPALPIHYGKNQAGMAADAELSPDAIKAVQHLIKMHRDVSLVVHEGLEELGLHKQIANRYLEAHDHITVVMTSTERANFYWQRCDAAAQPDIRELANKMYDLEQSSITTRVPANYGFHLPYVTKAEFEVLDIQTCFKLSVSRCAGVSYYRQNRVDIPADLERYDKLVSGKIKHWSPFQHQGTARYSYEGNKWSGNFRGWYQHRKSFEGEHVENYNREEPGYGHGV